MLERGTVELFSASTNQLYEKLSATSYFGLETLMTKTSRHWCSALSRRYTDLQRISYEDFQRLVSDYPKEGVKLLTLAKRRAAKFEILTNKKIFNVLSSPSSRSLGKNYEETYTPENIWIYITSNSKIIKENNTRSATAKQPGLRR